MAWWKSNGDGTGQDIDDGDWFELTAPCKTDIGADTMAKVKADYNHHIATCDDLKCRVAAGRV